METGKKNGNDPLTTYREGVRRAAPLGLAVVIDGVAFGALAEGLGITPAVAVAMSALVFSGAAQFTALAVMDSGGGLPAAALAAMLVSARALPMGLAAAPALSGNVLRRAIGAQLVVDESWAVGQAAPGQWDAGLLVGAGVVIWVTWLAGTVLGTLGGDVVADPRQLGLDVAFPALFLALLAPHLRTLGGAAATGASALLVVALVPVAPPGIPILAASLVCLAGLIHR